MKTFIGLIGEWKKGYEGMHIAGRGQTDGIYVGNGDEQLTVWTLWNVQNCPGCTVLKLYLHTSTLPWHSAPFSSLGSYSCAVSNK